MIPIELINDAKKMLQSMVDSGTIASYRIEGNDVYITLVRPVEHIDFNVIVER